MSRVARTIPALLALLLLSLLAIGAIRLVQQRAEASRSAQLKLAGVSAALTRYQGDPFTAMPIVGGSPVRARAMTAADKRRIVVLLAELRRDRPVPALRRLTAPLEANFAAIDAIVPIAAAPTFTTTLDARFFPLLKTAGVSSDRAGDVLEQAGDEYKARAARDQTRATYGSITAILLLLAAFAVAYVRSVRAHSIAERLAEENARLATASNQEARTDALTGLRNRRALVDDLERFLPATSEGRELALTLYDLDGFKHYNDTFGHPAGDSLLARLGHRLETALDGFGNAYRMGGDEFCTLAFTDADGAVGLAQHAAAALSEVGDAFEIGCSHGTARIPSEASTPDAALRLADQRMYEHKAERSSASRQSTDVLLKVLSERSIDLGTHVAGVAALATLTAEGLGLPDHEVKLITLAAELHDVGKTAIPDAILGKPGPLNAEEQAFMRRHTVIGERIILAAPSLAPSAALVRASHEAFDGTGYPDGLRGVEIPLGARIVAVCDAFDAMISERPYRKGRPTRAAIAELRRCAGTQFDPNVVEVFCALAEQATARSVELSGAV